MDGKQFKTVLFGYDKEQVEAALEKMRNDMETLAEDSKNKIKQAQNIAMNANSLADSLQKELENIILQLKSLKNKE